MNIICNFRSEIKLNDDLNKFLFFEIKKNYTFQWNYQIRNESWYLRCTCVNNFIMKLGILYNKILMHDIKKNYTLFVYFAITNYITTWCGG